jgi:hypothetical protein
MDLDDELRQLFTSGQMDVAVRPGAVESIVAGASRVRRRRIAAATAGGALAVVAAVVASLALAGGDRDAMPPTIRNPTIGNLTSSAPSSTQTTTSTSRIDSPTTQTDIPNATGSQNTSQNTGNSDSSVTEPPGPGHLVVGPTGYGGIRLGMTLQEAQATGLLGDPIYDAEGGCLGYSLRVDTPHGSAYISDTVQAIYTTGTQTPEGIGQGATFEQLKAVYPELGGQTVAPDGHILVAAPGNPNGQYRFWFNAGLVTAVSLQFVNQECWG